MSLEIEPHNLKALEEDSRNRFADKYMQEAIRQALEDPFIILLIVAVLLWPKKTTEAA